MWCLHSCLSSACFCFDSNWGKRSFKVPKDLGCSFDRTSSANENVLHIQRRKDDTEEWSCDLRHPLYQRDGILMSVCLVIGWRNGSHQRREVWRRQKDIWGYSSTRRPLGLDDRRWLFPRNNLHPSSDQVICVCQYLCTWGEAHEESPHSSHGVKLKQFIEFKKLFTTKCFLLGEVSLSFSCLVVILKENFFTTGIVLYLNELNKISHVHKEIFRIWINRKIQLTVTVDNCSYQGLLFSALVINTSKYLASLQYSSKF